MTKTERPFGSGLKIEEKICTMVGTVLPAANRAEVNLAKLTKLEEKVLVALLNPREGGKYDKYPREGNDMAGVARVVYGDEVFHCEKPGGHYCSNITLCYSAKSSLSRTLNKLWWKGLVKKGKPIWRYRWHKADPELGLAGYYGKDTWVLRYVELTQDSKVQDDRHYPRWIHLSHGTRVWWALTERGRKIGTDLTQSDTRKSGGNTQIVASRRNHE